MSKAILIKTDGYSIKHTFFNSYEDAKSAMDDQYKELTPSEWIDEFEEISECGSYFASLYRNGEDVFIWKIIEIPGEEKTSSESVAGFTKEDVELFKNMFSRFCNNEQSHSKCNNLDCFYCSINKAYVEMFDKLDPTDMVEPEK